MDSTPIGIESCPACERMAKQIADLQRRLEEAVGQRNGFALELQSTICSEFCGSKRHTERCQQLTAFLAANRKP